MLPNNLLPPSRRAVYICQSCRHRLRSLAASFTTDQKRWISRNHIRNIQAAEEEWRIRAQEIEKGNMKSMLNILEERGFINQIVGSKKDLEHLLTHRRVGVYAGIDPTAPSLHVGHMIPFMVLAWFYIHGYAAHFVLGGFTALIGDPTGRTTGRALQDPATRKANMANMHAQLKRLGASIERHATRRGYVKEWAWRRALVNNNTWWGTTSPREFLSGMGRLARIGPMLGRDTVKNRMEKGDGMSFAEFSYPLVQAWDWWYLFQRGVQIQIGGSDQFGNILAGAELVKKMAQESHEYQVALRQTEIIEEQHNIKVTSDPLGITVPLLTTASGEKFGKSAGNATWLSPEMTSIFELYQFFLRSADADVEKYLKLFTFMPLSEIGEVMNEHETDHSKRVAQHKLAKEFVELIYGLDAAEQAESEHRQLFNPNLTVDDITKRLAEADSAKPAGTEKSTFTHPSLNVRAQPMRLHDNAPTRVKMPRSLIYHQSLPYVLWAVGLVSSRKEGQRLIGAGGVYLGANADSKGGMDNSLNFTPAKAGGWEEYSKYIIDKNLLILRVGKWRLKVISIIPDAEYVESGLSCAAWEEFTAKAESEASDAPGLEQK
ncbi:tyrosine-tRNA ligase [Rhinocladiella mackenziei CBS 650.93]|uniref:Tyrosine--tRNA ligase n=1 Tax=Rhinocladiella mackenziei CBS 650.93 TaxID=1442369 RepID=A0A0D2GQ47_9EURO|nr:tyrosine-tRNA ligase [Rhinocladiella mackenziei CBS 650.93]KIX00438.1 tyrosine-tRNA ligase [Rhinocladiella mackenziei CBS 650.93]